MKLEKAIEVLSAEREVAVRTGRRDLLGALQLGIEALKYVLYRDSCPGLNTRLLLPGETEE